MRHSIWNTALLVAFSHFFLAFLIQWEIFFFPSIERSPRLFWALLLGHFETIGIVCLLILPLFLLRAMPLLRILYGVFIFICNGYLLLNQIFYQLFFDHFQLSYSEGKVNNIEALWDSFTSEISLFSALNFFLFILPQGSIFWQLKNPQTLEVPGWLKRLLRHPKKSLISLLIIFSVTIYFRYFLLNNSLVAHPFLVLAKSSFGNRSLPENFVATEVPEVPGLKYGNTFYSSEAEKEVKARLEQISKKIRDRAERPNIILITIESVGSRQMFKGNKFDREITPGLYQYSGNMAVFPTIYSLFPGTARSHVPLSTGGRSITWGSVYTEFKTPFIGPTLEGELKKKRYHTAMFSATDIDYENLDEYYSKLPYDLIFEPASATKEFRKAHKVNSWGIDERAVLNKAMTWVSQKESSPEKNPFFIHFRTVSTHHPYGIPKGFKALLKGDDRRTRHTNSLHFTDAVLGEMIAQLDKKNLLDTTLLFIVGDHGQAFGEHHAKNFTHKKYIYEDNIRTFLLVLDCGKISQPFVCERPGYLGDIMPTILHLVNIESPQVPGRSLFSPDFQEEIIYFHKNSSPALWGLRDGQWKFISTIAGTFKPELYDLKKDPFEQKNLASKFPERLEEYRNLCANWYIQTNDDFVSYLEGFEYIGDGGLTVEQTLDYGPKRMAFGIKQSNGLFKELSVFHPLEDLLAWTHGVPYPKDKVLTYEWISPSGNSKTTKFKISKSWSTTWIGDRANKAREEGQWKLKILDGETELLQGTFTVSKEAPLIQSILKEAPGPKTMEFGTKPPGGSFRSLKRIHPNEEMIVHTKGKPYSANKRLQYLWISPSGKGRTFTFGFKKGWDKTWVKHDAPAPMEEGEWMLRIMDGKKTLLKGKFLVDRKAELFNSQFESEKEKESREE